MFFNVVESAVQNKHALRFGAPIRSDKLGRQCLGHAACGGNLHILYSRSRFVCLANFLLSLMLHGFAAFCGLRGMSVPLWNCGGYVCPDLFFMFSANCCKCKTCLRPFRSRFAFISSSAFRAVCPCALSKPYLSNGFRVRVEWRVVG